MDGEERGQIRGPVGARAAAGSHLAAQARYYSLQTDQYSRQGSSRGKNTAAKVGAGAGIGAIIGAIAGGGKGAAIGAAAGGGSGWRRAGSNQGPADQAALGDGPELYPASSVDGGRQPRDRITGRHRLDQRIRIRYQSVGSEPASLNRPSCQPIRVADPNQ